MITVTAMSREDCEHWAENGGTKRSVVISIKSRFDPSTPNIYPTQNNNIVDVLRLAFNDAETDREGCIALEQATEIARFVRAAVQNGISFIVVHCDMGQSRSQGVAAAIAKHYNGDDSEYYRTATPSAVCHWRVLEALMSQTVKSCAHCLHSTYAEAMDGSQVLVCCNCHGHTGHEVSVDEYDCCENFYS